MRRLAPVLLAAVLWSITPAAPAAQSAADLFNDATLQRIELWLHSDDWEKLKQNFRTNEYYPADLTWNGQTVRNTGIRSRGLGSRSGTKPGLRVDFDYNETDQTFLGLKSLVLDNLTQDSSTVHETVTMKMFARLGVPAPREAHVRLYVNGRYAGLYAVVESIDKSFLARIFGEIDGDVQNDGYLYEFNYVDRWFFNYLGSDLDPYKERFDPKTHENKSAQDKWGPIENLVRLANELPSDQYMSRLNEHLDLRAFMRYLAAQNFMGQNDGFLGYDGVNNFYLYRLENSSRHVFLAWDEDNAFTDVNYAITARFEENVLARKALEVPELRDAYYETLAEAARIADERTDDGTGWLEAETRRQLDKVYDALDQDPNKPYSMHDHDALRTSVIIFAGGRARAVQSQLPR